MAKTRVCAVVLFLLLLNGGLKTATAQSPDEQLSGRFEVMWGDPETGNPVTRYGMVDSEGRRTELVIDETTMSSVGGLLSINRQSVVLSGNWQSPLVPGSQAQADGGQSFQVHSIQRQPALTQMADGLAPFGEAVVSGSQKWVTVLCRFGDSMGITPHEKPWFDTLMLGGSHPGMDHYWRELSYDQINLSGSLVVGWYNLPQPRSYYVYDRNGDGVPDLDHGRAAQDCATAADADVYFPGFLGVNFVFNELLDCCAWGGGAYLTNDGVGKGYYATWLPPWGYENQAVIGHEMGHGFGLPHSSGPYTSTYDSRWDVMSSTWGNCAWPGHPVYGCLGQHTISFHKDLLGWVSARRYAAPPGSSTIELERIALPSSTGYLMAKIPIGSVDSTQFYTVETRQRVGYDEILSMFPLPPSSVVVIHYVDTTRWDRTAQVVDSDGNGNTNDAGAIWLPGETFVDPVNQISVSVDSQLTATSFQVTITSNGSGISVTPDFQDFGTVMIGSSAERSFTVQNIGLSTLTGTASVSAPFSIVSGGSYNLASGESQIVIVRFNPTEYGTSTRSVVFTGGGGTIKSVGGFGEIIIPKSLSVYRDGTGSGRVVGPGIDCGDDCWEDYPSGEIVSLSAIVDSGSVFSGWSGDADCIDGVLIMNANKDCVATFSLPPPPPPPPSLPDLAGVWGSANQICRRNRCRISGSVRAWNQGNVNALTSRVQIVLSDDAVLDPGDVVLREFSTGVLRSGRARVVRVNIPLPLGVNFSGKYLFAVIDAFNSVLESDEANNLAIAGPIP